jgi:hypothetical protein
VVAAGSRTGSNRLVVLGAETSDTCPQEPKTEYDFLSKSYYAVDHLRDWAVRNVLRRNRKCYWSGGEQRMHRLVSSKANVETLAQSEDRNQLEDAEEMNK